MRMPMDQILDLISSDHSTSLYAFKVGDCLDDIRMDLYPAKKEFYEKLKVKMKEDGINKAPLLLNPRHTHLDNGHHRVKLGHEIGFYEMEVTDDYTDYHARYPAMVIL
jgi:hypothetical protein